MSPAKKFLSKTLLTTEELAQLTLCNRIDNSDHFLKRNFLFLSLPEIPLFDTKFS